MVQRTPKPPCVDSPKLIKSVYLVQEQGYLILQAFSFHVELEIHQEPCGKSIQAERFLILTTYSQPKGF
jgi:hypothetical protein